MRVPLNHVDILRIWQHFPERPPSSWIQVHPTDAEAADMLLIEGQPSVLFLRLQPAEKACLFLVDNSCSIHDWRPGVCRIWPFERHERQLRISPMNQLQVSLCCDQTAVKGQSQINAELDDNERNYRHFRWLIQQWHAETQHRPQQQTLTHFLNFLQTQEQKQIG